MKTALKKVCLFSLAAGLGEMIQEQVSTFDMSDAKRKITIWNAQQISITGQKALDNCGIKIDHSRYKQTWRKIDEIRKDKDLFDIAEMLSFLFLGLQDLFGIEALEQAVLNFITQYDPNLENDKMHEIAGEKYYKWSE